MRVCIFHFQHCVTTVTQQYTKKYRDLSRKSKDTQKEKSGAYCQKRKSTLWPLLTRLLYLFTGNASHLMSWCFMSTFWIRIIFTLYFCNWVEIENIVKYIVNSLQSASDVQHLSTRWRQRLKKEDPWINLLCICPSYEWNMLKLFPLN